MQRYLSETFATEEAVEWWATWLENGERLTMTGTTVLRFRDDGLIVDHRDYWNEVARREPPYPGW